ncbi:hypothetical protein F5Y19DRAFT_458120 [Xylariaceae sp. FL1651]|nr:hypothetical protein F5Y19DRAFT_458120 [Xylariaceae sp. FL1651]
MPQYKFVAIKGGEKKPSKPSGSIRSHAIRAGLQKSTHPSRAKAAQSVRSRTSRGEFIIHLEPHGGVQDEAKPGILLADSTTPEHTYRTLNTLLTPNILAEGSTELPICPIEFVYAGSVDPFNSLPVPMNPEVDFLVRYFLTKLDLNLAGADRKRLWFPYALQSAPMMHSTLAMTAALWRAEYPALEYSVQLEGIRQKGEAMRQIIARLAYASSVQNNEEVSFLVSAMSTLVIVELRDGDFEAAEIHFRGVRHLYNSGGGHGSFNCEFILRKSINIADILFAAAMGHQLSFPLLRADQMCFPVSISEQARQLQLDQSITNDSSYSHDLIFVNLRQLLLARRSSMLSIETLRNQLNAVDALILQHLYSDRIDVSDSRRRSRALVLAAHVFMYITLRDVPPKSPLLRRMCTRLQTIIGSSPSTSKTWTENRSVLLWVAFVGLLGTGHGTGSCPNGQWFLNLFHTVAKECSGDFHLGRGSIYRLLSNFLWDELHCQPLLADLVEHL